MHSSVVKFGIFCVFYTFLSSSGIIGQEMQDTSMFAGDIDPDTAYCFRFTWLGPKWGNSSEINGTCESIGSVPCKEPLVITQDYTPPNTTYMWLNYDINQIACRLTKGEVCTKWVQTYGGEVEFITYMCSKYSVQGVAKPNWEGCETDTQLANKTFINEVCACRSGKGVMPCNGGSMVTSLTLLLLVALVAALWQSAV